MLLQVIVLATYLLNEVLYLLLTLLLRHFGYDRKLVWTLLSPQSPLLLWNDPQRSRWCQLWLLISSECDDVCMWLLAMDTMDGDTDMDQDWSDLSDLDLYFPPHPFLFFFFSSCPPPLQYQLFQSLYLCATAVTIRVTIPFIIPNFILISKSFSFVSFSTPFSTASFCRVWSGLVAPLHW